MSLSAPRYKESVAQEMRIYRDCIDVHTLPPVFHYWSNRYLLPAFRRFGASSPNEMFVEQIASQFRGGSNGFRRFASLGSGNCDLEICIARRLVHRGLDNFVFDCVDLNPAMLERGRAAATEARLADKFAFVPADLNSWAPPHEYHAVMANQALHHIVSLEDLYGEIKRSLLPQGSFIISDMIGRNGHLRWPEALDVVHELWRELPPSYRMNRKSGCYEELFADHDCSGEGFEGVRSEDILPLLVEHFHFRLFLPYGNVIDPFVDRSFGPNFDPDHVWDRAFIDRAHERDVAGLRSGRLKPTHMFAVVRNEEGSSVFPDHMSPQFCVRSPALSPRLNIACSQSFYRWDRWPHPAQEELEKTCSMLVESAEKIGRLNDWALELEREGAERLNWGLETERQVEEVSAWALSLEKELEAIKAWGLGLEAELRTKTEWTAILQAEAARFQAELEDRTRWAQRLDVELEEKTKWSDQLRAQLDEETYRVAALRRELSLNLFRRFLRMVRKAGRLLRRRFVSV